MGGRGHARHRRKRQAHPKERLRKNQIGSDDENARGQNRQSHNRLQRNQERNFSDVDAGMADDVQTPVRFAPNVRAVFEHREKYIIPRVGEMKIDEITAPMLQRLFNKMISDGYALATVKKSKFLLGQFFEYCVDNDFLKTNPVAKTKLASRERKVQTTEEYKAIPPELRKDFVKALDTSPILKPICYTSLFAGLRIGEVLALRWRDVDFTDKTIWVDNAVTVIPHYDDAWRVSDYETVISDTKTAASVRSVPMPQILIDCLKEHRNRRRKMEYETGISFTDDDDLVFSTEEGELRTYYGTRAMFDKLMRKTGFAEYGFHFHTLRHTYSSMLFESGENPKVIQQLLGHKDVTTTIRTYNSVDKSYFKQATKKIDAMFGGDLEL